MKSNLTRWAIQKSGRLTEKSLAIINQVYSTNIGIENFLGGEYHEDRSKDLAVFLVRDDDIPSLVNQGYCDVGICSEIIKEEALCGNLISHKLKFLLAHLVYAENGVPPADDKTLVTKFPNIAKKLYGDKFTIIKLHGGTELGHKLGISSRLLELTQSGTSLKKYDYRIVQTIQEYDTELVAQKHNTQLFSEITRKITVPSYSSSSGT